MAALNRLVAFNYFAVHIHCRGHFVAAILSRFFSFYLFPLFFFPMSRSIIQLQTFFFFFAGGDFSQSS